MELEFLYGKLQRTNSCHRDLISSRIGFRNVYDKLDERGIACCLGACGEYFLLLLFFDRFLGMEPRFGGGEELTLFGKVEFVFKLPGWSKDYRHHVIAHVIDLEMLHLEFELGCFLKLSRAFLISAFYPLLQSHLEFIQGNEYQFLWGFIYE